MTRLTALFAPKLTMSALALGSALSLQTSVALAQAPAPGPAPSPGTPAPTPSTAAPNPAPAAESPAAPASAPGADTGPGNAGGTSLATAPTAEEEDESEADGKGKKKKKKKDKHKHPHDHDAMHGAGAHEAHAGDQKHEGKDKDRAQPGEVRTAAGRIKLKGRVLAQAAFEHVNVDVLDPSGTGYVEQGRDSLDLSIDSVRVGLEYQAPMRWLSAVAELELTGGVSLKDGYVQAREKHWSVRAGQFKMPVSAIEMESPWTLPLVRRGLIHDLLTDWLDVAGRHPGVLVAYRAGDAPRFRLSLGAFQGAVMDKAAAAGDRHTELIKEQGLDAQSLVARADLEIGPAAFGAWYEHRVGSPTLYQYDHYETFGLDAVIDHPLPNGGVRAWVEAMAGESWYEHPDKVEDADAATFVSARAIGAFRFGGAIDEAPYIEPFAFWGVFEPDTDIVSDLVWEYGVGVSAGFWRRARLSLEAEFNAAQRNFPNGYVLNPPDPDRFSLLAQAGVAW